MKKYLILTLVLICVCCNDPGNKFKSNEESFTTNNVLTNSIRDTKEKVLLIGDTTAYDQLFVSYLDNDVPEEILFYSLIMANEFDNRQAHFDVFINIYKLYKNKPKKMGARFSELAINHLLIAYSLGHHQAAEIVEDNNIKEFSDHKETLMRLLLNKQDR